MRLLGTLNDIYVPEFNGNKDEPAKDQIVVTLKFPTLSEEIKFAGKWCESKAGESYYVPADYADVIRSYVVNIKNLETDSDGIIDTGAKLMDSADMRLAPLVIELFRYLQFNRGLDEGTKKK